MSELAPGALLGNRFELRTRLGEGGSGVVWLARDSELEEDVALKVLAPELAQSDRHVTLLREECHKARQLQHPNIVRVHDFHELDGHYFISMQYVPGGSLVQRRGMSLDKVLPLLVMICDALEYAHRNGIIHRDLKPSNVLVDPRGIAYLADFGIAASLDPEVAQLRGGGSLPYMSPQQLDGAPPAVADDVYGIGSLLYELVAGQPLFHPGASAERVRDETPLIPETDGTGQDLPDPLRNLLMATLDKTPERRPAGIAAVRSVLDEALADTGDRSSAAVIQPVRRRKSEAQSPPPLVGPAGKSKSGLSGPVVLAGFTVLLLAVVGVVFLLPSVVKDRPPVSVRPPPEEAPAEPVEAVPDQASSPEAQARADEVLGDMLVLQERLKEQGVERWGGADWSEAERLAAEGDARYRERNYPEAAQGYRRSLTLLKVIDTQVEQVLEEALAQADAALLAGDRTKALDQYELALAVDSSNAQAMRGLERAGRLNEVLGLMSQATASESAGDLSRAADFYRAALEIDPDWTPAREGVARTQGALSTAAYEQQMAAGYAALARGDWPAGRRAFEAALRTRPGDADAQAGLQQLASEERLQQIVAFEKRARELAAEEDWEGAVRQYQAALGLDSAVQSARQGLAEAKARAELSVRLDAEIANADKLNDERIWQNARALADEARQAKPMGGKLAAQIAALESALRIAATPVPVRFESDNITDVVIYRVGRLGIFDSRTVDLRPGSYVAIGTRDGYRDARRSFRVAADGTTPPIVVRCEEPI
jgi:serine/threonine protein kinase/tetratricopeptide (TPR) repeat protein